MCGCLYRSRRLGRIDADCCPGNSAVSTGPGRLDVARGTVARLWRNGLVWLGAGFAGFMFATAVTGQVQAVADWQSAIVCGSGTHLSHFEYATQGGATLPDGSPAPASQSSSFTYHCVGPHSVSGSRTLLVLGIQFVSGTLVVYLLILALAVRAGLRRRVRAQSTA
jgi:hypothetical protein